MKNRRSLRKTCLILIALTLSSYAQAANTAESDRPNIVVILCDDLGYGDLACFGHPHIKTPHLDQMASDGIRLTSCYSAAPVCSPSRVGLLTGRSPNRAGVYDWIPPGSRKKEDARDLVHMQRSEITIAQLLKDAGYATCQSGKWHCNSRFNSPSQPQPGDFGFDHWFATQNNASPSHQNPSNFVRNSEKVGPLEGFSCQLVVDEAIRWLDGHVKENEDQPFFMFLTYHEPHEPIASPKNLVDGYKSVAKEEDEAQFFANVENLDNATGRFLSALDRLGKTDNTLVIFTSDNGPETLDRYRSANRSWGRPGPLRGMKLWTTDAGARVAGIMKWPAKIKSGGTYDQPVWSLDFLPTFCELAGATVPSDRKLDGADFLPVLEGKPIERSNPLFWCYFNAINEHRVALRDGDWKMLAKIESGKFPKFQNVFAGNLEKVQNAKLTDFELYRISEDIDESDDVISQHPAVASALREKLNAIYKDLATTSKVWSR